ncbi:MAG: hypothetical protein V3V53_13655, partial [Bacteroidales bacterium]
GSHSSQAHPGSGEELTTCLIFHEYFLLPISFITCGNFMFVNKIRINYQARTGFGGYNDIPVRAPALLPVVNRSLRFPYVSVYNDSQPKIGY